MKSKGLDFPDNFMDIFGFHRVEKEEVDERKRDLKLDWCDSCNSQFPLSQLHAYKTLSLCKKCFSAFNENKGD